MKKLLLFLLLIISLYSCYWDLTTGSIDPSLFKITEITECEL
ncbi:hypothetical protein [Jeotgalibacillus aurantiacus]|nr:hypothetical protein [Jeotgalibacillus aurantiacus]